MLEILESGKHGYVAQCSSCDAFTVAFGTTLTALFKEDIEFIQTRLGVEIETNENKVSPRAKAFLFRLSQDTTCQLVLTYDEMGFLYEMLTNALLVYEIRQLINPES